MCFSKKMYLFGLKNCRNSYISYLLEKQWHNTKVSFIWVKDLNIKKKNKS